MDSIQRKSASPDKRCVYNSTTRFGFEDECKKFLLKLISFLFVCLDGMLVVVDPKFLNLLLLSN